MPRSISSFSAVTLLAALALAAYSQSRRVESDDAAPAVPSAQTFDFLNWRTYLGDPASSQYSSLDQINRSNVQQLKIAWTYNSGGLRPGQTTQIQCNPLIIGRVLFGSSADARLIFALNAANGEELWTYDTQKSGISRGLTYWQNPHGEEGRLFFSVGDKLGALDPDSGRPIVSFGDQGTIDLHNDLGRDVSALLVQVRTPRSNLQDTIIIGSVVSEGPASAPGHVRAYDVRTGKPRWIFHAIPQPGEFGGDTWPVGAHQRFGGANAWSGITVDHERGIVFLPTCSPAFDFWGGSRPGDNLFANCLLAIDANTGKRIWHFQFVHHDLWDRDLPSSPNLLTVTHKGKRVDAVAQATKSGHVFLFERETGQPLFPSEERSYPTSDLRGEQTSPTQPLPLKPPPQSRQQLTEEMLNDHNPEHHADLVARFRTLRSGGQFVQPSPEGTIIFPGFDGGAEWGGAAVDPNGMLYVNTNEMPWILTMVDLSAQAAGASPAKALYIIHCGICHGLNREGNITAGGTFPPLVAVPTKLTREQVDEQIRQGKGVMPGFRLLTDEQRGAIISVIFGDEQAIDATPAVDAPSDTRRVCPSNFAGSAYGHTGYNRFVDPNGNPAVKPPWGNALAATRVWQGQGVS
jgi:quinoprotein glucose dehydrogenase